jgi:hypothetical protein
MDSCKRGIEKVIKLPREKDETNIVKEYKKNAAVARERERESYGYGKYLL